MTAKQLRPQLSEQQYASFRRQSVLRYSGVFGAESVQLWDPVADVQSGTGRVVTDYTVDFRHESETDTRFRSVQAAVNQAVVDVARGRKFARIYIEIAPGDYEGLVYVPRLLSQGRDIGISLTGQNADAAATRLHANIDAEMRAGELIERFAGQFADAPSSVRIVFDKIAAVSAEISTANASVLRVENNGFQASNITVQNTYNADRVSLTGERQKGGERSGVQQASGQHQAVALMVAGADKVFCHNLRLKSYQDTLYLRSPDAHSTARSCFLDCDIEGDVDFIFGQATAFFQHCTVRSLGSRAAHSWVVAPSTCLYAKYGFVFDNCDFVHDGSGAALAGRFSLGRQWFEGIRATPYGVSPVQGYRCELAEVSAYTEPAGTVSKRTLLAVGRCVITNSRIGRHINPAAPWDEWNGGSFTREGVYQSAVWNPRFRPVHTTVGCVSEHLQGWFSVQGWQPIIECASDVLLGEYNNTTG